MTLIGIMILAAAVRISRWPTPSAVVLGGGEYDPPVMYLASASFLHGLMPYRDFTFLHPPGVLLGLAPSVLVGGMYGDAVGMATARVGVVFLGMANAGLVALLLRRYGASSMLLGGGLYAGWSALAYTEQQPLLEPFLVTALLVALHLYRSERRWSAAWMGLVLGVATMVKVWAAVDLIVLAAALLVLRRFMDLGRFTLGAAVGGSAVGLPFFVNAPSLMWEMVVTTQIGRPRDGVSLLTRAAMFGPAPSLRHPVYQVAMALLLLALLGAAVLLIYRAWSRRAVRTADDEEGAIWASIALSHALVMSMSGSFYDHYAMFVAAPLTLAVGAAWAQARERMDLDSRRVTSLLVAAIALVAAASVAGSLYRVVTTDHMTASERVRMAQWANDFRCTWSSVSDRVLIDEVVDALRQGCAMTVDPYGESLLARSRGLEDPSGARNASEMAHLPQADGLVLPANESRWPFSADDVKRNFAPYETSGDRILWVRTKAE